MIPYDAMFVFFLIPFFQRGFLFAMNTTPKSTSSSALGSIELAVQRSQNPATLDRLVFAARPSTGLAALVQAPKAVGKTDWR